MKIVIQRVKEASVKMIEGETRRIKRGIVIFLGLEKTDTKKTVEKIVKQILPLRLFPSAKRNMDRSILEEKGEILLISQITLGADFSQGNCPDFSQVASFQKAKSLYDYFLLLLQTESNLKVVSGKFGAMMKVGLINDGPVTVVFEEI
jgi:D-tyrosyl-tRNA(Tyr) deacylase